MTSSVDRLVWYASYGSNLSEKRFGCYLAGGRPDPASARVYSGARDTSPSRASVALELRHRLYFTGDSPVWSGATAFLDTGRGDAKAWARAYLVTWEQFEDVVAQECRRGPAPITVGDAELDEGFCQVIGPGRYETLVCAGRLQGVPVVTVTAPWTFDEVVPAPPVPAYLAMMISGLRDAHQLTDADITAYLAGAPGCTTALVETALALLEAEVGGSPG